MRQAAQPSPDMGKVELAGCAGKDRFDSHSLASQVAARMNRRGTSRRLMAYRCKFCTGYHVGNAHKG